MKLLYFTFFGKRVIIFKINNKVDIKIRLARWTWFFNLCVKKEEIQKIFRNIWKITECKINI